MFIAKRKIRPSIQTSNINTVYPGERQAHTNRTAEDRCLLFRVYDRIFNSRLVIKINILMSENILFHVFQ